MKYMLILIGEEGDEGDQSDTTPEELTESIDRWSQYGKDLVDSGVFVASEALQESPTAKTVHVGAGEDRLVTDGPFAETKEQLGGFYLLDCEDLDQALEWAKKVPLRPGGSIEIRPVMDYTEFGFEPAETRAEASS